MKTVDARGLKCPMPLIETKKALMESGKGESLRILIDNETSFKNVSHYLADNGIAMQAGQEGDNWEITVDRGEEEIGNTKPEEYCEVPAGKQAGYVILLSKNRIGEGSEELGEKLVGSLLESLKAQDVLPARLIFMNSGIHLVTRNSPALPALVELELNGVEMISCGTCLNYFNKMDELAIGRVSNMFEIVEIMRKASNVISL